MATGDSASSATSGCWRSKYCSSHSDANSSTRRSCRSTATAPLAAERRHRPRRIGQPSRARCTPRLDLDLHAVLGAQPAGDHVELQRADDADDRLAAAGGDVEHLHQPFFFELPQALVELLVARVLQADAAEVLRRKARHVEKPQRRAGVQRVADRELSRVDEADDVAGVGDARSSRDRGRRSGRRATPGAASRRGC